MRQVAGILEGVEPVGPERTLKKTIDISHPETKRKEGKLKKLVFKKASLCRYRKGLLNTKQVKLGAKFVKMIIPTCCITLLNFTLHDTYLCAKFAHVTRCFLITKIFQRT